LQLKIMKKIIKFLVILSVQVNAQIVVKMTNDNGKYAKDGNYIKDSEGYFDKFTGTWKYINGNEEFIISISKAEHLEYSNYFADRLCGGYRYVKDGVVKANRLDVQCANTNNPQSLGLILGGSLFSDYQKVSLLGSDVVGKREVRITLEVIPNTYPVQMRWKMENRENFVINNKGFKQGTEPGIPKDVILIKQ